MNDPLAPTEQEYLGIPLRKETLFDEMSSGDYIKLDQTIVNDPNGTYRQIEVIISDPITAAVIGDKKAQIVVPFDGTLVSATGAVSTVGSGVTQVSLTNAQNNDILAGWIEMAAGQYSSLENSNQPYIELSRRNFVRNDLININVDAIGAASTGLIITLYFIVGKFYFE
jgi:hypothetical protein